MSSSHLSRCQLLNLIAFTASVFTLPGLAATTTRLSRNISLLADRFQSVDLENNFSIGYLVGTLLSVVVGFRLP